MEVFFFHPLEGSPMKPLSHDTLHERGLHVADAYCAEHDYELLQAFRNRISEEEARKLLVAATGVQDEITMPGLANLPAPQFLAVLGIFPMIDVAWCDGWMGSAERRTILKLAHEMGVQMGTPAHDLLDRWLVKKPEEGAALLWEGYVQAVIATLHPVTVEVLKERVIRRARRVAAAEGGVFNFGRMISAAEENCLARLEMAFERDGA
jgi:hypothetical protein